MVVELTGTQTQSNITACEEKKTSEPEHERKERCSQDYDRPLTRFSHSHSSPIQFFNISTTVSHSTY